MVFQMSPQHGQGGEVNIRTIDGTLLKKLKIGAGEMKAGWDGRDESGQRTALGVYIYEITENGGGRVTGNLAIVK
jgi:flagellar hook assembly protein FlgD